VPTYAWALAALTALAAALRFSTLGVQSYWLDESVTVYLVGGSFHHMWSAIPNGESTPPLYYVVAWLWSRAFGTGEVGLRSLSALAGTATVPAAYVAAARLVTPRAGLLVAALAAVNPLLVWFSQEARAYAVLVLLTTAALAVFAGLLQRATARRLAAWAVLSAAALATHYFAIFLIAPQAAWLVWRLRDDPRRRAVLVAVAGVAVAGAALLPLLVEQAGNDRAAFLRHVPLGKRVLQIPKQFLVGFDAPLEVATSVIALLLAVVALWLLVRRADSNERSGAKAAAWLAAAALGVPLVLALAGADYLIARNLIAAWVPAAIVLATGFGAGRAGRAGLAAAGALCAVSLFVVIAVDASPKYQRGDWRGVARALGSAREERGLVVTPRFGDTPLSLYTRRILPFPSTAVPLREIDVIGVAERRAGQTPEPPRPSQPPVAPAGYELVQRRYADTFTLLRYRAPPPNLPVVFWWQLRPMKLTTGDADVAILAPP
jgi:hypothetical protein